MNPAATLSPSVIGANSGNLGGRLRPAPGLPIEVPPVSAVTGATALLTSVYMTAPRAFICSPTPTRPSNPPVVHLKPQAVPGMPLNPLAGDPVHARAAADALDRRSGAMVSNVYGAICMV